MNCALCRRKASINTPFGERHYCDKHFLETIEKRIRKEIRTKQQLDINKTYYIYNNDMHEYKITQYFLKKIFNKRLKTKETKQEKKANIIPQSIDYATSNFLKSFMENKKYSKPKINPLITLSQNEMKELCRILKIKFKTTTSNTFLDKLENNYPGTKFSVLKFSEIAYKK